MIIVITITKMSLNDTGERVVGVSHINLPISLSTHPWDNKRLGSPLIFTSSLRSCLCSGCGVSAVVRDQPMSALFAVRRPRMI